MLFVQSREGLSELDALIMIRRATTAERVLCLAPALDYSNRFGSLYISFSLTLQPPSLLVGIVIVLPDPALEPVERDPILDVVHNRLDDLSALSSFSDDELNRVTVDVNLHTWNDDLGHLALRGTIIKDRTQRRQLNTDLHPASRTGQVLRGLAGRRREVQSATTGCIISPVGSLRHLAGSVGTLPLCPAGAVVVIQRLVDGGDTVNHLDAVEGGPSVRSGERRVGNVDDVSRAGRLSRGGAQPGNCES